MYSRALEPSSCVREYNDMESPPAMGMPRTSGLQQEVFGLYRQFLRTARRKDPTGDKGLVDFAKKQFRAEAASASRFDFQKIEYMIRKGQKQLRLLNMPGVEGASGFTATA